MEADTTRSLEACVHRLLVISAGTAIAALSCAALLPSARGHSLGLENATYSVVAILGSAFIYNSARYIIKRSLLRQCRFALARLYALLQVTCSKTIKDELSSLITKFEAIPQIESEIRRLSPTILARLQMVESREEAERDQKTAERHRSELRRCFAEMRSSVALRIEGLHQASPAVRAGRRLTESIAQWEEARKRIQQRWDEADSKMSWWQKLNHEQPDFKGIDQKLTLLKNAQFRLVRSGEIEKMRSHFADMSAHARNRINSSEQMAINTVPSSHRNHYDSNKIAKHALWLSALSVPVSVWSDITQAGDIYNALRRVNQNYANLSDAEIWLQSLLLPSSSLAGLVSLTKGSYFEILVAGNTGGTLFASLNHPDTDITIDSIEYQLKATDSEAYINTVADGIPVIATSEVAEASGAIDSGITNAELERATELALGGSVVDVSDMASDAVLVNLGGLSLLATIRGVGHAARQYNAGQDGESAIIEGVEMAVTGTIKSMVDTAELGYKALNSRPSRFVGRQLGKVASRIGRAIDGQ